MATLVFDFQVGRGFRDVNRALDTIEKKALKTNRAFSKAGTTSKGVGDKTKGSTREQEAGLRRQQAALKKVNDLEKKGIRDTARAKERSGKEKTRTAQREADKRLRAEMRVQRETQRGEDASARKRRSRRARRLRNFLRMRKAETKAELRAQARETAGRRRTAGRIGGAGVAGGGRALRGIVGLGAGALSIGGGFAVAGAIQRQASIEGQASALANQAFEEGGPSSRAQIRERVLKQANQLGAETGLGATGVISGLRQVQAISGRLDLAQQLAPLLADIADASDADISDVGRTTGQIIQSLGTKGLDDPEILAETTKILGAMLGQAKKGSIEFADLSTQMGKVLSSASGFNGNISELVKTMGAASQLAIAGGASSAEEAMTSILRFRDDLIKNRKKFGAIGVDVFERDEAGTRTGIRDPLQLIPEILAATKGDVAAVASLFGIRSTKAFEPFQQAFLRAGGGEEGQAAASKLVEQLRGAEVARKEITESAAFRRAQADKQLAIQLEKLNQELGSKLLPTLIKAIPQFAKLVPLFGRAAGGLADLAEFLAKNPFLGIGGIVAAAMVKDIALAAIGEKIAAASAASIASAQVGAASKGALTGSIAAAGIGVAVGAAIVAAVAAVAVGAAVALDEGLDTANELEGTGIASKVAAGAAAEAKGPQAAERRRELLTQLKGKLSTAEEDRFSVVGNIKEGAVRSAGFAAEKLGLVDDAEVFSKTDAGIADLRSAIATLNNAITRDESIIDVDQKLNEFADKSTKSFADVAIKLSEAADKLSGAVTPQISGGKQPNVGAMPSSRGK